MEGLRRHKDRIRFVLVQHEEAAAFMATSYAKSTGWLGVCVATSGPGGLHLLNGLYDAKLDHAVATAASTSLGCSTRTPRQPAASAQTAKLAGPWNRTPCSE